jgi:purine-binding chemotaxis protein CheW
MDILAARKKAAERVREQKAPEENPAMLQKPVVQQEETKSFQPAPESPAVADAAADILPPVREPQAGSETAPTAAEAGAELTQAEELEMLSFRLGGEEYAVMVDDVKEVLKMRQLTPVPNSPDYILGVTAIRGLILPVVDLAKRLGLPPVGRDDKSRIVVLNLNDGETGVAVERVTGVVKIHPEAIRPAPDTVAGGAEFLKGIARKNEKLYILLDSEKALGA